MQIAPSFDSFDSPERLTRRETEVLRIFVSPLYDIV